jgi:Leucine-rich repeat (LRR) protein
MNTKNAKTKDRNRNSPQASKIRSENASSGGSGSGRKHGKKKTLQKKRDRLLKDHRHQAQSISSSSSSSAPDAAAENKRGRRERWAIVVEEDVARKIEQAENNNAEVLDLHAMQIQELPRCLQTMVPQRPLPSPASTPASTPRPTPTGSPNRSPVLKHQEHHHHHQHQEDSFEPEFTLNSLHQLSYDSHDSREEYLMWPHCLRRMVLFQNKLRRLPKSFETHFQCLETLALGNNLLSEFPNALCYHPCLKSLDLSKNRISKLPNDLGSLLPEKLVTLHLGHNRLIELPSSLGNHKNLEKLYINQNGIKRVPQSYFLMRNLEVLHVQGNRLIELPSCANVLDENNVASSMRTLNVSSNNLTSLPSQWFQFRENSNMPSLFPKLRVLSVHDNKLGDDLPTDSLTEIRRYFHLDLIVRHFQPTIRLVLLGDDIDGKECLFSKLTAKKVTLARGNTGTNVSVARMASSSSSSSSSEKIPFQLELWNLGHESNTMFLEPATLGVFAIVFAIQRINCNDTTTIDTTVQRWVQQVQSSRPGAQIVLVAAGCEHLDPSEVKQRCDAVEARVHLSNRDVDDEIEKEIQEELQKQFHDDYEHDDSECEDIVGVGGSEDGNMSNDGSVSEDGSESEDGSGKNSDVGTVDHFNNRESGEENLRGTRVKMLKNMQVHRQQLYNTVVIPMHGNTEMLRQHILGAAAKVLAANPPPKSFPKQWHDVVEVVSELKASGQLFVTPSVLIDKYKAKRSANQVDNPETVVKDALKWLAKHSELEDCSATLGVVMLGVQWANELCQCILSPQHIQQSLAEVEAEQLLCSGILKHCHLEALLDHLLDRMGDDRECGIVLLYELLRHFEVLVPLSTPKVEHQDDNDVGGGALDEEAVSLVPSLLKLLAGHSLCWDWPVPEDCSEYSRSIHFRFMRPPNIMPRLYARAAHAGFDLNSKDSIIYRDAAILDFRHTGVRVAVWVRDTHLEIFCRTTGQKQNSTFTAFTALKIMCQVALSVMDPKSYPGHEPFKVQVMCSCCAHHSGPEPPSSQWLLSEILQSTEIIASSGFRRGESSRLSSCKCCGATPELSQLVFVEENDNTGPSVQHLQMMLQQQQMQLQQMQQQQMMWLQQQQQMMMMAHQTQMQQYQQVSPLPQHVSRLPAVPKFVPPIRIKNTYKGVVRIAVATLQAFGKRGSYEVEEMGSGVLLEVDGKVIVMTAAHVVLDSSKGWAELKTDPSTTKIFVGVYRAEELASRWLFEVDVDSLMASAKQNYARKGGPVARCKPRHQDESAKQFQIRVDQERCVVGVHDVAVMTLSGVVDLYDDVQTTSAFSFGGNMEDMVAVKFGEGRVGEEIGKTMREHDLKCVRVRAVRPLCGHAAAANAVHNTPGVGVLKAKKSRLPIGTSLKLLGWPSHEFVNTSTFCVNYLYDGSIFAADGNVLKFGDCMYFCDLTNYPGGSGGPALDEQGNIVGILSMGNNNRLALVCPVEYGLSLVPYLSAMDETKDSGSEALPVSMAMTTATASLHEKQAMAMQPSQNTMAMVTNSISAAELACGRTLMRQESTPDH